MQKASTLSVDAIIVDLEDAVSPDEKDMAREQVVSALTQNDYGEREVTVRINPLDSRWGADDIDAIRNLPVSAVVIPKCESSQQVLAVHDKLRQTDIGVWVMIETPRGVLHVEEICSSTEDLHVLVMGTSDLAKDLRVPHNRGRQGFQYALGKCVLAARAFGKDIIDGVHLDLASGKEFLEVCDQGREMGFDGKSLIHPDQISAANRIFAPSRADVEDAYEIIEAWDSTEKQGSGVVVVRGKLVESLHIEEARRTLALHDSITKRGF
jgi:citrate lyase subunit beta/citryl-CoA lyase